ncbi:response regulator transcription factor [Leifsonia sp. 2MCAF36]|uniref:helix-turn-helix transcriptional regulator n=1 Tax=Leifsonia sp. 2MCAF36 TaxID=3232988 RepID=UPI003F98D79D
MEPHITMSHAGSDDGESPPGRRAGRIDAATTLARQADHYRLLGQSDRARAAARAALTELESAPDSDGSAGTVGDLYARVGAHLLYAGAGQEALDALERGLMRTRMRGEPPTPGIVAMLAGVNALNGHLAQARDHILAAHTLPAPLRREDTVVLQLAEALVALDQLDAVTAQARLAEVEQTGPVGVHWILHLLTVAMTELLSGHPGQALARLEQSMRSRGPEGRTEPARRILAPVRALLQSALGRPDAAVAILDRDAGSGTAGNIGRARAELVRGRHGAALQQLRAVSGAPLSARKEAESATLEASALLRISTDRRSMAVVEHAGAVLRENGLLLPLVVLPPSDLERVSGALTEVGYADLVAPSRPRSLLSHVQSNSPLTRREAAVLAALLDHPSHAAVAAQLHVSVNTVKSQLRSVYRKLDVKTRDEAIAIALERHLLGGSE